MFTETWAAAYFESLITILVFVLGVPALLIQLVAPSVDLHRLVQRRFRISVQAYVVMGLAIGFTIFFAWYLHPDSVAWDEPALSYANGLMSCAIVLAGGAWVYYFQRFTRTGIISRIKRVILASHRRHGLPHEEGERNLGFLGEASRAGREKEQILRVFADIFTEVIAHPAYDGTRLLTLVTSGVGRTLLTPGHLGDERNFRDGAKLLAEARRLILDPAKTRPKDLSSASDIRWIDDTISALARAGARAGFHASHELLGQLAPERLLEVGIAAWAAGRVTIYTNAVGELRSQRLDALAEAVRLEAQGKLAESLTTREKAAELLSSLVALLAHLASGGPAARRWSEERLVALRHELGEPEFQRQVERAFEDRYQVGDFDSADALKALGDRLALDQGGNEELRPRAGRRRTSVRHAGSRSVKRGAAKEGLRSAAARLGNTRGHSTPGLPLKKQDGALPRLAGWNGPPSGDQSHWIGDPSPQGPAQSSVI